MIKVVDSVSHHVYQYEVNKMSQDCHIQPRLKTFFTEYGYHYKIMIDLSNSFVQ